MLSAIPPALQISSLNLMKISVNTAVSSSSALQAVTKFQNWQAFAPSDCAEVGCTCHTVILLTAVRSHRARATTNDDLL